MPKSKIPPQKDTDQDQAMGLNGFEDLSTLSQKLGSLARGLEKISQEILETDSVWISDSEPTKKPNHSPKKNDRPF